MIFKMNDRTGEINYNNFGSKMIIKEHRSYGDIDIYFPEYDCVVKHKGYSNFKKGKVKCPYEPRYYGKGYLGEGIYTVEHECFSKWYRMLQRCYDPKYHEKEPSYIGCSCEEFHCLQDFGKWYDENYYEIEGQKMCLDKDILYKNNKIYSSDTCIFVPQCINNLFTNRQNHRGEYPLGVTYHKHIKKYTSQVNKIENNKLKRIHLGYFDNPHEAFLMYKFNKELVIENIAKEYKDKIPNKLYEAMVNYKINEND